MYFYAIFKLSRSHRKIVSAPIHLNPSNSASPRNPLKILAHRKRLRDAAQSLARRRTQQKRRRRQIYRPGQRRPPALSARFDRRVGGSLIFRLPRGAGGRSAARHCRCRALTAAPPPHLLSVLSARREIARLAAPLLIVGRPDVIGGLASARLIF